jgi:hypothetical protein
MITSTFRRQRRLGVVLAGLLLVLLTAQPALAVDFGAESRLSALDNYEPQIVATGPSSAVAIWQRGSGIYARRTADGGATWSTAQTLATSVGVSKDVAASGAKIDLVYVKRIATVRETYWRLYYRRSLNGGITWAVARPMTSATSRIMDQAVARHSDGQVSIVWTGMTTGSLYMRTSIDGGTTFGLARYIGRTANSEPGRTITYRSDPVVAIGTGVTYVAYTSKADTLSIERSLNRGVSWSSPRTLSLSAEPRPSLVAYGSKAVVGYTLTGTALRAVYRRTLDKGTSWSITHHVTAVTSGEFSMNPRFAARGNSLAVVVKAGRPGASPVWYRDSADFGATWSVRRQASLTHVIGSDPVPGSVAILGTRRLVAYSEYGSEGESSLWVRRGQ